MTNGKQKCLYLDHATNQALAQYAKRKGVTQSHAIREILAATFGTTDKIVVRGTRGESKAEIEARRLKRLLGKIK